MIKLLRIDDRLVHGQVALTWTPSLGAEYLLVANDKTAKDEFVKMTMNLAKPAGTKLLIKSVDDAAVFLNDPRSKPMKILVLVNSVQDAQKLVQQVAEIQSVNFGGIRGKDGSKLISKAVAVTEADIAVIREMASQGIELELRQVPTDKKIFVQDLI